MKYRLIESRKTNIPHRGLITVATYLPDYPEPDCLSPRRVVFCNRHAPLELNGDFVTVKLDAPYVQEETVFCPKTKEGLYLAGYSPEEQKARLMHRHAVRM